MDRVAVTVEFLFMSMLLHDAPILAGRLPARRRTSSPRALPPPPIQAALVANSRMPNSTTLSPSGNDRAFG